MRANFEFPPLHRASFLPLRGWASVASPQAPLHPVSPKSAPSPPARAVAQPLPAAPQAEPDAPALAPDFLLEAGDPTADPDALLARTTLTGLTEQALLHALNHQDLEALQGFAGFGPKVAASVLAYREREKFFTSLDELVRVPLVGPVRFRRLVGRESLFFTLPLHSALRLPPAQFIHIRDLAPLVWPAPGLPRLLLSDSEARDVERRLAAQSRWHLHERRLGAGTLFVHTLGSAPEARASFLLQTLPRLLRTRLARLP